MHNLIDLIRKYQFIFVFILLQIIAMILLINRNSFHRFAFLNTTSTLVGGFLETQADIKGYFRLKNQMVRLQNENANLRTQLCELEKSYFALADTFPNISLDSNSISFIQSRIINVSKVDNNQYLTINKGSAHGISKQMGVISTTGVVGKTLYVSNNYSIVMSILHKSSYVNVKVGDKDWSGSLNWKGDKEGYSHINSISKYAEVNIGDSVYTNNYSTTFPENIMVGRVSNITLNNDEQFYDIEVKLNHDFNNLDAVYLLKDTQENERLILEDSIRHVSR